MVTPVSPRHWGLREVRQTYLLHILVALAVFTFIYFIGWSAAQREELVRSDTANFEQRFAGSVVVPAGNDLCRGFVLDNRTGDIRDGGYIKCAEAMRQSDSQYSRQGMDMLRLREVGNAFRH
jgi:hypothetical protein